MESRKTPFWVWHLVMNKPMVVTAKHMRPKKSLCLIVDNQTVVDAGEYEILSVEHLTVVEFTEYCFLRSRGAENLTEHQLCTLVSLEELVHAPKFGLAKKEGTHALKH